MTPVQETVAALAAWRAVDTGEAAVPAWCDGEKALVASLALTPAFSQEDAEAKARELLHLIGVGDFFADATRELAEALARDVARLSPIEVGR